MTKIFVAANLFSSGEPEILPTHQHDCEQCVFLGWSSHGDHWFCTQSHTLIVRKSDEGADYASFPLQIAIFAADGQPGTRWSVAVSLYDDFQGSGRGDAHGWDLEDPYETVVGLYGHLKVRKTERNVFVRDQHGNPLGVARIVKNRETRLIDRYEFRAHEDCCGSALAIDAQFHSLKSLYLYCMTIQQDLEDAGY